MKDCCADPENLTTMCGETSDVTVKTCKACGCRHIELTLDPGKLGLTLIGLTPTPETSCTPALWRQLRRAVEKASKDANTPK